MHWAWWCCCGSDKLSFPRRPRRSWKYIAFCSRMFTKCSLNSSHGLKVFILNSLQSLSLHFADLLMDDSTHIHTYLTILETHYILLLSVRFLRLCQIVQYLDVETSSWHWAHGTVEMYIPGPVCRKGSVNWICW